MHWKMSRLACKGLSGWWEKKPRRGLNCIVSFEHLHISWLTSTSAANIADRYKAPEGMAQAKHKAAICGPGLFAKRMRVESPEPTEADSQDGEPVAQMNIQPSVSETMVAWHRTKLVMDMEPIECGVPDRDVHMPQMAGKGDEKTEVISMQYSVVHEAWRGWEVSLRTAHRMRQVAVAA